MNALRHIKRFGAGAVVVALLGGFIIGYYWMIENLSARVWEHIEVAFLAMALVLVCYLTGMWLIDGFWNQ